ncbi:MAG: aldose 1-epimerase family protein [Acidobacteria bacterium]|nr:aldose 1-epimerase family protein [Acidobacteriota bacterium]
MKQIEYHGRRAVRLENDKLRVTLLVEGGHVAEIADQASGVNPLWTPPWPSIEPSAYSLEKYPLYGTDSEAKLLSGIMGHNLCLDLFGGPGPEEAAAGFTAHGEASVLPYTFAEDGTGLVATLTMPLAQLRFERRIRLAPQGTAVQFTETVENLTSFDRPLAWTQHVTLGPPFLERGSTQFRLTATRAKTFEKDGWEGRGGQKLNTEFEWPFCPAANGGTLDLRVYNSAPVSGGITTQLMDPAREQAFFIAYSPASRLAFGYVWQREDFPWMARWEENHCRAATPWNSRAMTCGMEFGASPMPESRREMVERGKLFGVPAYRWLGAKSRIQVKYCAFLVNAAAIPEKVVWEGDRGYLAM